MPRSSPLSDSRRSGTAALALLLVIAALVPLAQLPAADASTLTDAPTFTDEDGDGLVNVTEGPSPLHYLGAGEGGLSYVAESAFSTLASAYGFDPEVANTDRYGGASEYLDSLGTGNDVLAVDVVDVPEGAALPGTYAVQIARKDGAGITGPWLARAVGPQSGGYAGEVAQWTFGAAEATDTAMPGEPVGVAMMGTEAPVAIFATTEGVFGYLLQSTHPVHGCACAEGTLALVAEGGSAGLGAEPAAITHIPDIPDLTGPEPGRLLSTVRQQTFVVATRAATATAGTDRLANLLVYDYAFLPLQPGATGLPVAITPTDDGLFTSPIQTFPSTARVSIGAGPTIEVEDPGDLYDRERPYAIGVQAGGEWYVWRWWTSAFGSFDPKGDVSVPERFACPETAVPGAYDDPGFDFLTSTVPAYDDGFLHTEHNRSIYVGACAVTSDATSPTLLVGTHLGPGVDTERNQPRDPIIGTAPTVYGAEPYTAPVREVALSSTEGLVDPQVELTLPCYEARRVLGTPDDDTVPDACADANLPSGVFRVDQDPHPGLVGVTMLAGVTDDLFVATPEDRTEVDRTALVGVRPFAGDAAEVADFDQAWVRVMPDHAPVTRAMVRAPDTLATTKVLLDDEACVLDTPDAPPPLDCDPTVALGNPLPMAVMVAPPHVEGAGQDPADPPIFARSSTVGGSDDRLTSTRVGASLGVQYEDPSGAFGVSFEATYEREVEETVSYFDETTQGQAFFGSTDADTVIYNATSMWELPGTIVESSVGLGVGTATVLRSPRSNVMGSASFDFLQQQYPDVYGENTPLGNALRQSLGHTPGDPGSYLRFQPGTANEGASVDNYCVGNIDGTEPIRSGGPGVFTNPFTQEGRPVAPDDAILVSEPFNVLAGTSNSEAAIVELVEGTQNSYLGTHSVDLEVAGKVGYVTAGASVGSTWGSGWTYSVSDSTEFAGNVGHIPFAELQDETYEWRMFVCKRDIGASLGGAMPIWVMGYTVDGYQGSGGFSLGPVVAVSPTGETVVDPAVASLVWRQDEGTIERFDWELEAIGAADTRTGAVTYDTLEAGRDPGEVSVPLDPPLLADQLYRWRVTATDFFGNEVVSEHEFFATAGAPDPGFTWSPAAPVVGEEVTLTAAEPTAPGTSFTWDLDGTNATGRVVTHTFGTAGERPVSLEVATASGAASGDDVVPVRSAATDDLYEVDEDDVLVVDAPGVLANDTGATTATLIGDARLGDLRFGVDGGFTYRPDPDACGTDSFAYEASGGGLSATAPTMVTIVVACVDDPPAAVDDLGPDAFGWDAVEDTALVVSAPGVLANDTDVDSAALTAQLATPPTHGDVTLAPTGAWTYVPDPDACGADAFAYLASDGTSLSEPATVAIDVACVNDPPVTPSERRFPGIEDTPVTIPGPEVDDPDVGDTFTIELVGEPEHGTPVLQPDGSFVFTPDRDHCGTASFGYRVVDSASVGADTQVVIDLACVDDLPPDDEAPGQVEVAADGEPTVVELAPGTETIVVTVVEPPTVGTVEVLGSSVTYTPLPGECGIDGFVYTLTAPDGSTVTRELRLDIPCGEVLPPDVLRVLGGPAAVIGDVLSAVQASTGRVASRLAGTDRYATSAAVAREAWPTGADTVFVATGADFPDGLAAGATAARFDAPMVLAPPDELPDETRQVLVELAPRRVVVLGGTNAVSAGVNDAIADVTGVEPERIGGADRYATAAAVATAAWSERSDVVYLATGATFPDALAGAAAASMHGAPVLLTRPTALPAETVEALVRLAPSRIVVLGGEAAIAENVVDEVSALTGIVPDRVAGADRYATASAIARDAWPEGTRSAYLATGTTFPDAVSGAAAAGRREVPVLLLRPTALPASTRTTLQRLLEE